MPISKVDSSVANHNNYNSNSKEKNNVIYIGILLFNIYKVVTRWFILKKKKKNNVYKWTEMNGVHLLTTVTVNNLFVPSANFLVQIYTYTT